MKGSLTNLGTWMTRVTQKSPITNVYGLARSILAFGTLITLLFNSVNTLFTPASGTPSPPYCENASGLSIFCVSPSIEVGRWISIGILIAAASGFFPRWTAIPHWYVAFSLQSSASTLDGGDQVSAVLTLLIVPIALCDGRRTHWDQPRAPREVLTERRRLARLVAFIAIVLIRLQVAVVYFQAGVAKFGVTEWVDGTAMYYWLTNHSFGSPPWYRWLLDPIIHHGFTVTMFTWSMMLGEVVLSLALVLPQRTWRFFLVGAIAFHAGIALIMGLLSFAFAMIAMDIVFLHAADQPLRWPRPVRSAWARFRVSWPRRQRAGRQLAKQVEFEPGSADNVRERAPAVLDVSKA